MSKAAGTCTYLKPAGSTNAQPLTGTSVLGNKLSLQVLIMSAINYKITLDNLKFYRFLQDTMLYT